MWREKSMCGWMGEQQHQQDGGTGVGEMNCSGLLLWHIAYPSRVEYVCICQTPKMPPSKPLQPPFQRRDRDKKRKRNPGPQAPKGPRSCINPSSSLHMYACMYADPAWLLLAACC